MNDPKKIGDHYQQHETLESIRAAVDKLASGARSLTPAELSVLDEFHIRGREATVQLAGLVDLKPADRVLDIGCGIGGPARFLASRFGCRVQGVDLTPGFCQLAADLTERVGLTGLVRFRQADAADLPFADCSFDLVWIQHASMNISDKRGLFAQMHRVLRPGGRVAMHEVMLGPAGEPKYPVPWADEPSISYLQTPATVQQFAVDAGFAVTHWIDDSENSRTWAAQTIDKFDRQGMPQRGVHLLMGPQARTKMGNMSTNLQSNRIVVVMATLCRAAIGTAGQGSS